MKSTGIYPSSPLECLELIQGLAAGVRICVGYIQPPTLFPYTNDGLLSQGGDYRIPMVETTCHISCCCELAAVGFSVRCTCRIC